VLFVIAGAIGCLAGVSWWVGSGEGSPFIKGFPIGAGMLAAVCFLIAWRGLVVEARKRATEWIRLLDTEKQRAIEEARVSLKKDDQPPATQNVTTSPIPDTLGIVREVRVQMDRGSGTCRCECVVDFHDYGLCNNASPKQLSVIGPGEMEISTLISDSLVIGTGTVTYGGDVNVSVIDACMGAFHPSVEFCPIEVRIAQDSRLAHGGSHVKLDYELGPLPLGGDLHKKFLVHVKGAKVHWPSDLNAERRDADRKEAERIAVATKELGND